MRVYSYDLIHTFVLIFIFLLLLLAYGWRVFRKGRAQFDRVDRQGGSIFLGKPLMEMAYWGMQPLARSFIYFGVSPHSLSWASFFFGLATGCCLAHGHFGFAGVFSALSGLLDSLDGMVARLTDRASDAGEVLDAAVDRYVEFFFLSGLVLFYHENFPLQLLALLTLLGCFMMSYSTAKAEALGMDPPKSRMRRPERAFYLTLGAILSPLSGSLPESLSLHSEVTAFPMVVAMLLVAGVSHFSALERFVILARWAREKEKKSFIPSSHLSPPQESPQALQLR